MARRLPKGVRQWKGNLQAYVRLAQTGPGALVSKTFPADTDPAEIRKWRALMQLTVPTKKSAHRFESDVTAYLTRITALQSYKKRAHHLQCWLDALGRDRPRHSITTAEIERVMQAWLVAGKAPQTVRNRRISLMALFTKLDGRAAANPARAATPPRPTAPLVRGLTRTDLKKALAKLPKTKTGARLRVLAWTGLPPGMLMKVTDADVNLRRAELTVVPRRKGGGAPARKLPLTPQAVQAFRELRRRQAFGPFNLSQAGRVLRRACAEAKVPKMRLYDLRHTFAALLYERTHDLHTVSRFLLHASLASTARYASGAIQNVDRKAARRMG
jgi:integrase